MDQHQDQPSESVERKVKNSLWGAAILIGTLGGAGFLAGELEARTSYLKHHRDDFIEVSKDVEGDISLQFRNGGMMQSVKGINPEEYTIVFVNPDNSYTPALTTFRPSNPKFLTFESQ